MSGHEFRDAGLGALVSNHVLADATRYIMQFETGSGDYTKIRKNVVMGKRVADLYKKSVLFEKKKPRAGVFKDESVSHRNTIHGISLIRAWSPCNCLIRRINVR